MPKYIFDFNLSCWVRGLKIEADTYEEAKEELLKKTAEQLLEEGYCNDSDITDLDYTVEDDEEDLDEDLADGEEVNYCCWIDKEGTYGLDGDFDTFEEAKEYCIENNFYSVEKQVYVDGERISEKEVFVNPDYDENAPEEEDDDYVSVTSSDDYFDDDDFDNDDFEELELDESMETDKDFCENVAAILNTKLEETKYAKRINISDVEIDEDNRSDESDKYVVVSAKFTFDGEYAGNAFLEDISSEDWEDADYDPVDGTYSRSGGTTVTHASIISKNFLDEMKKCGLQDYIFKLGNETYKVDLNDYDDLDCDCSDLDYHYVEYPATYDDPGSADESFGGEISFTIQFVLDCQEDN